MINTEVTLTLFSIDNRISYKLQVKWTPVGLIAISLDASAPKLI